MLRRSALMSTLIAVLWASATMAAEPLLLVDANSPEPAWQRLPKSALSFMSMELGELRRNLTLAPSVYDLYFPQSDYYDSVALPVLSARGHASYRIEVVGQLYDRTRTDLLNIPDSVVSGDALRNSTSRSTFDQSLAVGLGASYNVRDDIAVQALFSTGTLPNYGDSNLAMGVSLRF